MADIKPANISSPTAGIIELTMNILSFKTFGLRKISDRDPADG